MRYQLIESDARTEITRPKERREKDRLRVFLNLMRREGNAIGSLDDLWGDDAKDWTKFDSCI